MEGLPRRGMAGFIRKSTDDAGGMAASELGQKS